MMSGVLERFSDEARRVLSAARQEAKELGHDYVGTGHFLLGILRDAGSAANALEGCGISFEAARSEVVRSVGCGSEPITDEAPFTPRAKKVLALSLAAAENLDVDYVRSEHLLLGLIDEGQGVAMAVLSRRGVNPEAVIKKLRHAGVLPRFEPEEIGQALTAKGIETTCRRCGRDEWAFGKHAAIVPDIADHVEMAGGTAASVRVCAFCGCIELYNPGVLYEPRERKA